MTNITEDEKLSQAINDTGFCLEYEVYRILKAHKWNVISNRYYIDDIKGTEREIDIVAYKGKQIENVVYYTALIISCKMSKKSYWVFLTHELEHEDPNFNYTPIHNVSSDNVLNYFITSESDVIINRIVSNPKTKPLLDIEHKVFAFQQMNSESLKTEDDKKIYESIITTIKALEHEKQNHKTTHVKDNCTTFYNFNLLSIYDHGMKEIYFDNDKKIVSNIEDIKYINRHIVNNRENFYRVHFVDRRSFDRILTLYDQLYSENNLLYSSLLKEFYTSIWIYPKRVKLFWKEFESALSIELKYYLRNLYRDLPQQFTFSDEYFEKEAKLCIHIDAFYTDDELRLIKIINDDSEFKENVAKILMKYYHYDGEFFFAEVLLPF